MGGAAASRIPPTWGYSRDEAFELAGGSKPGSHWDEARWESLKNDEGFIPAKAWKSEVARINQEVMQKMMEQQAEAARKAAAAKAAAEEKKRKAAAKAAEEAEAEKQRLQAIQDAKDAEIEAKKKEEFEKDNPLRKMECVHELVDAGAENIIRCCCLSTPIIEAGIDESCDELRSEIDSIDVDIENLTAEREEFIARRKKASAAKRQEAIDAKLAQKRGLRQQIRTRLGAGNWMAAFAYDDTAHVINLKDGKSITTLRGHSGCINALAFSPDRKRVVSASKDGLVIVWDIEEPGFKVGDPVESRAVAEVDLQFPDKPPRVSEGDIWFKGVLNQIRDEGKGARSYDVCYDEERWVETNKRNCEPTIIRTCPVNDKILAEWAAEQAADEQTTETALSEDEDSEPEVDVSQLSGRERRAYERAQKKKAEAEAAREAEEDKQMEEEEQNNELKAKQEQGSSQPSGIPAWQDTFPLPVGTVVESIYRGTEDWAVAEIKNQWAVRIQPETREQDDTNDTAPDDDGITASDIASQEIVNTVSSGDGNSSTDTTQASSSGGVVATVRDRKNDTNHQLEDSGTYGQDFTYVYDIEYQRGRLKGKVERKKDRSSLRRVFNVDDRVGCRYRDGESWLEARVTFVRKNRTYDLKYDTGLKENCVDRHRMRKGLDVGDSVKCIVRRDVIAAKKAYETALMLAKKKEKDDERAGRKKQQRKRRHKKPSEEITLQLPEMKEGRIIKIRELAYDILFDDAAVQARVPASYFDARRKQNIVLVRPIAKVHCELKHRQGVTDVDYHPREQLVCTASGVRSGTLARPHISSVPRLFTAVVFITDHMSVQDAVRVWYTTNGASVCVLRDDGTVIATKESSTSARRSPIKSSDRPAAPPADGKDPSDENVMRNSSKWLLCSRFSSGNGDSVVAAGHGDYILVFNWRVGQLVRRVQTYETSSVRSGIVYSLVASPTTIVWAAQQLPAFVATLTHDKTLRVWNVGTKLMKEVSQGGYAQFFTERPSGQNSSLNKSAFSPDMKWIFAGGPHGALRAWEVDTGKMIHNDTEAHENFVSCVAVAPITRHFKEFWMVTGGVDGVFKIWTCDFGIDPAGADEDELRRDRRAGNSAPP